MQTKPELFHLSGSWLKTVTPVCQGADVLCLPEMNGRSKCSAVTQDQAH